MLVAALVAASLLLFVFPPQDRPGRANAVVVLSGGKNDRLPEGIELVRRGVAPLLVISDGRTYAPRLCAGETSGFRVLCFRPDPYSTRGEAEEIARLAHARRWRSVVVVTSRYHVFRARVLFRRCFHGRVAAVGSMPDVWHFFTGILYEWPKLLYEETLLRGC